MPRKTKLVNHLTLSELEIKMKRSREPVARHQLQVIYLIKKGKTQKEVAEYTGYSTAWVHTIVRRYNELGPDSLRDHRRDNPGRPYRLSNEISNEIKELLATPPPNGGVWTGPLLVAWVHERTGDYDIDNKRGWEWLRQFDCKNRLRRQRKKVKKGHLQRVS